MNIRSEKLKGLSYKRIAEIYNIDRRTAKKYANEESKPKYNVTNKRKKIIEKYADYISQLLNEAPYSAVRIKELVEEHFKIKIGYTTIQEYVKELKAKFNYDATIRFETMPGVQAQVDWGFFENYKIVDDLGEEKKLYCFLMILGYSRMRYIEFVTDMSTETLIKCHLNAFNYFGGYPQEILYDNMKQVVIKRLLKQKDSKLNPEFEDFAGFFKFKPMLCRPYRGQTKGKVERTVRYVRENFMVGIKFDDLQDLNKKAYEWCEKVNSKVHSTTNEIPKIRLRLEGLNEIKRTYLIDKTCVRKAQKDCLISYDGNKYSVPSEYVDRNVIVVRIGDIINVYCNSEIIASHPYCYEKNKLIIDKSHYSNLKHSEEFTEVNTLLENNEISNSINLEVYNV